MVRFRSVALAIGLLVAMGAQADVRLPGLFSDHMVVQRGRPIPVWGWGTPGQSISVSLAGARGQAFVGPDSTWRLELAPLSAGGPHQLVVEGDGRVVVDDVLVGEVWVGSGQSNMQWTVSAADNSEAEIAAADHPGIRLFHVPRTTAAQRQTDVDAAWQVCSPETIPGFSAVAYFFGRRLHEELDVPIGLIHSSWGGTRIEPWTDLESLRQLAPSLPEVMRTALEQDIVRAATPPSTDVELAPAPTATPQQLPGALYHAMIHPLIPFAIRGAIWYQGKSNLRDGGAYAHKMEALIDGWRRLWGQPLSFYYVQLAPLPLR
jgi:sialate O-acetylesterase